MKKLFILVAGITFAGPAWSAPGPAPAPAAAAQPASNTQAPAAHKIGPVVANVGPATVTLDQLQRVLIDAYGLNVVLNLVQLEIAKANAVQQGITVTPQDIQREREKTVEKMFEQSNEKLMDQVSEALNRGDTAEAERIREQIRRDNERGLEQFLAEQKVSRAEFDIVTETNAYLSKLAEPMLAGKITDDQLREAFGALYGETVKCRHIQCANMSEINEARRRLAAGEPFAKVAQEMSRHPTTGAIGGQLPPFSMNMQGFPQAFRDVAFSLKEGQVSDPVQADGAFHLILLEQRIPPKIVKFDDVKENLRKQLEERAIQAAVKELRQQLADQAVAGLSIADPVLRKQWEERLAKREASVTNPQEIKRNLEKQRPTTSPVN